MYGGRVIQANDNSIARLVFGDVWSLDLASKQWTLLNNGTDKGGPPPRFLHASAMVNATTLAVFGGLTFYGSSLFALDDVWLFELPTRTWRQHKMGVPLLRSALPMALSTIGAPPATDAASTDPAALVQVPALCAFGGYVIYTNAGLAVVYNDLLVWNLQKGYWEKFVNDRNLPAPPPRFDHRGVLWRGTTLVFYGGSYQSVNDVGDVWMLDTADIEPAQLVKAPAEGINALFYGRLLFIFASLLTLCFFSLCFSLRMRMNIMARARMQQEQEQEQQQLAAGGLAGPNRQMDAATRAERQRQTEEALRLLPIIAYQRPVPSPTRSSNGSGGGDGAPSQAAAAAAEEEERGDDTCAICLSVYEPRDRLRCLPCGHRFHQDCCDQCKCVDGDALCVCVCVFGWCTRVCRLPGRPTTRPSHAHTHTHTHTHTRARARARRAADIAHLPALQARRFPPRGGRGNGARGLPLHHLLGLGPPPLRHAFLLRLAAQQRRQWQRQRPWRPAPRHEPLHRVQPLPEHAPQPQPAPGQQQQQHDDGHGRRRKRRGSGGGGGNSSSTAADEHHLLSCPHARARRRRRRRRPGVVWPLRRGARARYGGGGGARAQHPIHGDA